LRHGELLGLPAATALSGLALMRNCLNTLFHLPAGLSNLISQQIVRKFPPRQQTSVQHGRDLLKAMRLTSARGSRRVRSAAIVAA
jgi:hypothetical protein